MNKKIVGLAMLAGMGVASSAFAQANTGATITDDNAVFHIDPYLGTGTGTGPTSSFSVTGAGGANHLSQAWWWFRADNATRETALSGATGAAQILAGGSRVRLQYNYGTFAVTMEYSVSGLGAGFGVLTQTVTVRNLTDSAMSFNLFNYNDVDVLGTNSNDTAQQTGPQTVRFTDGAFPNTRATYEATNAIVVDSVPLVRNQLTDNAVSNLTGGVVSGGPGDLSVASQFAFNLDAGGTQTVSVTLTVIPAPGAMALMGVGGLLAARRKRA